MRKLGDLHDEYYPQVYRYLHEVPAGGREVVRRPGCRSFLRLLEHLHRNKGEITNVRGWLLGTARHLVQDTLRGNTAALPPGGTRTPVQWGYHRTGLGKQPGSPACSGSHHEAYCRPATRPGAAVHPGTFPGRSRPDHAALGECNQGVAAPGGGRTAQTFGTRLMP